MRVFATALAPFLLTIAPAAAQDRTGHAQTPATQASQAPHPHAGHFIAPPSNAGALVHTGDTDANAADRHFDPATMARAREQLRVENGEVITHAIILDRLEVTSGGGQEGYAWDAQGWYGGDINRLWWKSEGEGAFDGEFEHAEIQLLYSRAVTPYFDLQGGIQHTFRPDGDRTDLVLGLQGLAPYWFEVDGALYLSDTGVITASAHAEYDLRLTQRLIVQPRAEVSLSAQAIPEFAIGSGISDVVAGVRLRYEIGRSFAPYVGIEWSGAIGETRDLRESAGENTDATHVVIGARALF